MAGVELLAQAIDSVIMRVQVKTPHFVDRIFRPGAKILKVVGRNLKGYLMVDGWSSGEVVKQHGEVGAPAWLGAAWHCP